MTRYYITHTDKHGERHQLSGAWDAATPEAAVEEMLADTGSEDDGNWIAHVIDQIRSK